MGLRQKFCDSHINWYQIRTKFVRISYEYCANFTLPEYSYTSREIRTNSYEIHANFVRISYEFM